MKQEPWTMNSASPVGKFKNAKLGPHQTQLKPLTQSISPNSTPPLCLEENNRWNYI